jgi:hypothetical protein
MGVMFLLIGIELVLAGLRREFAASSSTSEIDGLALGRRAGFSTGERFLGTDVAPRAARSDAVESDFSSSAMGGVCNPLLAREMLAARILSAASTDGVRDRLLGGIMGLLGPTTSITRAE